MTFKTYGKQENPIFCIFISIISIFCSLLVLVDYNRPQCYNLLFLLPLCFAFFSLIFAKVYYKSLENIGILIILILTFCRLVVSPALMVIGNYQVTIDKNIEYNTSGAILLVIYETFVVFFVMNFLVRQKKIIKSNNSVMRPNVSKIYILCILFLFFILLFCISYTPRIITSYRNVFQITDEFFSNFEDYQISSLYSESFISKFCAVTGTYILRIFVVLIPSAIIILLAKKQNKFNKVLSVLVCFIPLFFIGGAIARSLIYMVCLFFLVCFMFNKMNIRKWSIFLVMLAGILVLLYWIIRSNSENIWCEFSSKFSAYFSGVNVVSGVFNLPENIEYKVRYFMLDFTSTFPYGTTIFGIAGDTIQPFFNKYNSSYGQIPTTIGMGYYYFGPLLSPIYSLIFTLVVCSTGEKLRQSQNNNPFGCLRRLLIVFYFSMGICMYNIEITMTNTFCIILPLYILEKISYGNKKVERIKRKIYEA